MKTSDGENPWLSPPTNTTLAIKHFFTYLLSNICNFQQILETVGLHERDIVTTQGEEQL